jgi:hypothetical protein
MYQNRAAWLLVFALVQSITKESSPTLLSSRAVTVTHVSLLERFRCRSNVLASDTHGNPCCSHSRGKIRALDDRNTDVPPTFFLRGGHDAGSTETMTDTNDFEASSAPRSPKTAFQEDSAGYQQQGESDVSNDSDSEDMTPRKRVRPGEEYADDQVGRGSLIGANEGDDSPPRKRVRVGRSQRIGPRKPRGRPRKYGGIPRAQTKAIKLGLSGQNVTIMVCFFFLMYEFLFFLNV